MEILADQFEERFSSFANYSEKFSNKNNEESFLAATHFERLHNVEFSFHEFDLSIAKVLASVEKRYEMIHDVSIPLARLLC